MRTSTIVCAVLAGTFGFSSIASAQQWEGRRDRDGGDRDGGQRFEQRQERHDRQERRAERDHRDDRGGRDYRAGQWQQQQQQQHRYVQQQPNHRYYNNAPAYTYNAPAYRAQQPRFYRGGYVPQEYRSGGHYVRDWHSQRGLYAPPAGHQWMQVGSDFLLVALATGLIANLLTY
jgi:Ni/Co efflux regulator RcnB